MVNYEMSETKYKPKRSHEPFEFFSLEGRRRFRASELAVAKVMARLIDESWKQEEKFLRAVRIVQKEEI